MIALLHFRMKCLARFKNQKYDFITHQEFSMTKHFSFETNESRRHFMKLIAGYTEEMLKELDKLQEKSLDMFKKMQKENQ